MAKPNGLAPGEVDYVFAGSTAARFSALTSGSVEATILFPPFNFLALRAGYTSLGLSGDYTKSFPFATYSVNLNWARDNKDIIRRFLAARQDRCSVSRRQAALYLGFAGVEAV